MGGAVGNGYTNVYMGPEYTDEQGKTQPRIGNMTPFAEFNIKYVIQIRNSQGCWFGLLDHPQGKYSTNLKP